MIDLDYSNLLRIVHPYKVSGRTESTAFLHWFLVNIYRLDIMEVEDIEGLLKAKRDTLMLSGYPIRGIFITNIDKDYNAESLLEALSSSVRLEIWDKSAITQMYVSSDRAIPSTSELSFDVFGFDYAQYNVNNIAKVVIAPLAATDLVKMEGLENQQLFDLNLRKSLGKTKVNKDITKSIYTSSEHSQFLLYHNGITIICSKADTSEEGKIKIQGYAVVNGCQSVSCLYENRDKVTKDLRILTRIIEIAPGSELTSKITHNSNNQNGIKPRDFRSNTATQVRLQREISQSYPEYFYQLKRGEDSCQRIVIENELAGRILLAFDLRQPWAVQRTKKIFDESHQEIFARPEVTGGRIVVLFNLYKEVEIDLNKVKPELFSRYQITKFFLLYLLAEVLSSDEVGKDFCKKPEAFYQNLRDRANLLQCIHIILGDLIIDLNAEFAEREGESFDFKAVFKAPNLLSSLKNEIVASYQKVVTRGRVESFSQLWNKLAQESQ